MITLKNIKMKPKLIGLFLIVGLAPLLLVGWWSSKSATDALMAKSYGQFEVVREIKKAQIEKFFAERQGDIGVLVETVGTLRQEAFHKLEAVQQIKKSQIEAYFRERLGDASVLAENDTVVTALEAFEHAFNVEGDKTGGTGWNTVEAEYGQWLTRYKEVYGYYDLFLISEDGDVVYTVAKEPDLGQNLVRGTLKDSPLGRVFTKGRENIAIQDFEPYVPSNNEPCAFVSAPVKRSGRTIGVVALQLPLDAINSIMQERTGLGRTGEVYLVGPDTLMRSDSFLDPIKHSVRASFANPVEGRVDTEASREALAGKAGEKVIIDYNGNPVLSVYAPLMIKGIQWAIIAEIDVAEAFSPVNEEGHEFYASYKELYGYYDLFLVNPDGYAFYTVEKELDYQTNLVSGKYSNSNLGRLVKQALQTKQFGFVDFEPYEPSNNEPAAFIAQPLVHENEVEVIVALQLSLESINSIMQQRDGMGETGETYLVGSDTLMRSDSYLDPEHHSVHASFAKPETGKVDTQAVREALSGETGEKIIADYRENPVLSAYTPVTIGETTWALLAEIDEAEIKAPINRLVMSVVIAGAIIMVTAIGVALVVIRGILNQLGADPSVVAKIAQQVAQGDLNVMFDTHGKAAKGVFAAMKTMVEQLNQIVTDVKGAAANVASGSQQLSSSAEEMSQGATEQAASAEEASSSMEQMASNIRQNADNAIQTEKIAIKAATDAEASGRAVAEAVEAMQQIADKITIIEEIARQTHMLSLNATIEAARAQEYGKGFGVVAAEVRQLAERSRIAATEITQLAGSSITVAENASEMLNSLVPDIQKTAELVQEITAASSEQDRGTSQINLAIQQLDKVTQQNSSSSEELSTTAEELAAQAEHLQSAIAFFKTEEMIQKQQKALKQKENIGNQHISGIKFQTEGMRGNGNGKGKSVNMEGVTTKFDLHLGTIGNNGDEQDSEFERF